MLLHLRGRRCQRLRRRKLRDKSAANARPENALLALSVVDACEHEQPPLPPSIPPSALSPSIEPSVIVASALEPSFAPESFTPESPPSVVIPPSVAAHVFLALAVALGAAVVA